MQNHKNDYMPKACETIIQRKKIQVRLLGPLFKLSRMIKKNTLFVRSA